MEFIGDLGNRRGYNGLCTWLEDGPQTRPSRLRLSTYHIKGNKEDAEHKCYDDKGHANTLRIVGRRRQRTLAITRSRLNVSSFIVCVERKLL